MALGRRKSEVQGELWVASSHANTARHTCVQSEATALPLPTTHSFVGNHSSPDFSAFSSQIPEMFSTMQI
ncbi:hypothetical protein KOR42_07390 [Thalassoglobus neptunius]|uniref:Uncharacterized protein n=1 Tax=Thalassoglobus neptunius TaxID=1938619 RepID=A0A5C5X470_9PLAN|nr:hypothetical protein KOR42_07390 [Thalassoglobus neptunius]